MNKFLSSLVFIMLSATAIAQNSDYLTLKDSLTGINCATRDTTVVNESLRKLAQLNPDGITENKELYYGDLYNAYYFKFLMSKDSAYVEKQLEVLEELLDEFPENSKGLWESAFTLGYIYDDCERSLDYLDRYIKYSDKEIIEGNQEQVDRLRKKCEEEISE